LFDNFLKIRPAQNLLLDRSNPLINAYRNKGFDKIGGYPLSLHKNAGFGDKNAGQREGQINPHQNRQAKWNHDEPSISQNQPDIMRYIYRFCKFIHFQSFALPRFRIKYERYPFWNQFSRRIINIYSAMTKRKPIILLDLTRF